MLILANIFGWTVAHWRIVAIGAVALVLFFVVLFTFKSCNKPEMSMTEQEKQEVLNDIEDRNEAKLKDKLIEIEVREQAIDGNVANANADKWAAIQNSKEKWANANISDMQAEFDRRMNK